MTTTGIRRVRRNAISNAIGVVAPALAWVMVVPFLVHSLGEQGYGVYTIAISFAGMLGFLELGLTSAATKYIAEVDTQSDPKRLEKIVSSNLSLYVGLGGVITLLCFISAPFIAPLMFRDSNMTQEDLALIVSMIGLIFAFTLLRNALSSVLMGLQRYDIYNGIQVTYAIALTLVQGTIAINGGQVTGLMLGNIVVMTASLIGLILAIHHLVPGIHLVRFPDTYFMRVLFSFGMYMMLINLAGTILFNVDKVIIGHILGSESVTFYAIPTQITLKIHNGLAVFVSFIFPLTSEVQSIGDKGTLKKIYLNSTRVITLLDGLAMVFLGTFAHQFLTLWIGPDFSAVSAPILILTALGYLLFALSITPYYVLLGMGHPRELAILNTLATLCVTSCLYVGVTSFGLIGGSVGAAIGMGAMVILPWYVQRLLGISWRTALRDGYGRNVLCSICGIVIGALLPNPFTTRVAFYIGFTTVLLLVGNTRREDWRIVQSTWQQAVHKSRYWLNRNGHRHWKAD
jgi:O-antigen/teichoic acid export membrane protein